MSITKLNTGSNTKFALSLVLMSLLAACSDSSDRSSAVVSQPEPEIAPDFSAVDTALDEFVAAHPVFEGASIVIVDKEKGTIHEAAFGDHTLETVVQLASTSKVPSVSLLMALDGDENLDFEIDGLIENYLPWEGVWPGVTTEHLVSNRSGIPGLFSILGGTNVVHICQFLPVGQLRDCAQTIFETPTPGIAANPPGTVFEYGGGPWQLAGGVAEVVGGATWSQLWDQYIGEPCDLEVFRYANQIGAAAAWDGTLDGLSGLDNPNIEGGAVSNLSDYAKLLSMHLNDGACGENQVLSKEAVEFMRLDRSPGTATAEGGGYGMGWWVIPAAEGETPTLFDDAGAFGAISWIDTERQYAGYVAFEDYTATVASEGPAMVRAELIPMIAEALDAAR